jgi:hypothetical protein
MTLERMLVTGDRDMEIWVPKAGVTAGSAPTPDRGGMGSMATRLPEGRMSSEIGGSRETVVDRHGARIVTTLSLSRACHSVRRIGRP